MSDTIFDDFFVHRSDYLAATIGRDEPAMTNSLEVGT